MNVTIVLDGIEWIVPRRLTAIELEELVIHYSRKLRVDEEQDIARPEWQRVEHGAESDA